MKGLEFGISSSIVLLSCFLLTQVFFVAGMLGAGHRSNLHKKYCEDYKLFYDYNTRIFKIKKVYFKPSTKLACWLLEETEDK